MKIRIQSFILLSLCLKLVVSNGIDISDGKPLKIEIDGHDKEDVAFDIDGEQFDIPIVRKEHGMLDFLPEDLRKEENITEIEPPAHGEILGKINKKICFIYSNYQTTQMKI